MNKTDQLTNIIYEFTLEFCRRYTNGSYLTRKMREEARLVKENLSPASLARLLESYKEFILANDIEVWPVYSLRLRKVKGIAYRPYKSYEMYEPFLSSAERAANAAVCLIIQTSRLVEESPRSALDYKGVLLLNEI
ncbi:hypothetical protein A2376_02725 [Candidatus Woesebacteria bacterium RIFOXYB1_FULL_47_31]|nr:MAG: hypothetical protein A2376_02725 [Candidatus Woesebacteria bacterium RIFOXYB1_FULL_47_31]OGM86381.1 MAG: hypothetical protein A2435_00630 [Candidatus Woesebacteria bacterium RIFOXYC1_FULL_46_16]OGM89031.1 MAG: hypothetical protein A2597_00970 [Candidatus Woesebacteria bacterium RIFOXYD1_FULL_46_19]